MVGVSVVRKRPRHHGRQRTAGKAPRAVVLPRRSGTISQPGFETPDGTEQQVGKKRAEHRLSSPEAAAEASRWCQRALAVGERAAREEYYQEERRKDRQDRRGYAWWRSNVHQRLGDYGRVPDRKSVH